MSVIDTLITDRTQADVDRVLYLQSKGFAAMTTAEQNEFLTDMKGAYNASDLNRIGEACAFVRDKEISLALPVSSSLIIRTNWAFGEIPTSADLSNIINTINALKSALSLTTPETPATLNQPTFEVANRLEEILVMCNTLCENIVATYVYCGQPYCGQIWGEF